MVLYKGQWFFPPCHKYQPMYLSGVDSNGVNKQYLIDCFYINILLLVTFQKDIQTNCSQNLAERSLIRYHLSCTRNVLFTPPTKGVRVGWTTNNLGQVQKIRKHYGATVSYGVKLRETSINRQCQWTFANEIV